MIKLMRELLVVAMLGVVSVGAFAQKKDNDKRPPKERAKVIDRKENRPPPKNTNERPPRQDKPKRPGFIE